MSAQPSLDSLLNTVLSLDAGIRSGESASKLLEQVLAALIPQTAFVRVYRLGGDKAFLQAATRSGADIELAQQPIFGQAARAREIVQTPAGDWLVPLLVSDEPFGLLEVGLEPDQAPPERVTDHLQLAANILSAPLFRLFGQSRDLLADDALSLVQAQYESSSTIHGSDNLVEVVSSLNNFVGGIYAYFHLGVVENSAQPALLNLIVEGDSEGVRSINRQADLADYPAHEALIALEALHVQDIDDDLFLNDAERESLRERNIRSILIVPLVVNQRITGLVYFRQSTPTMLSPARLRALRTLADQLAVVLENKTLLRSTADSLEETRTLYEINQAIVGAQDMLDILRLLRDYIARNANMINHIVLDRDDSGAIRDLIVRHTITDDREQVTETRMSASLTDEQMASFTQFLSSRADVVTLQSDIATFPAGHPIHAIAELQNFKSYVVLRLIDRAIVTDLITINFSKPQQFNAGAQRLFETIADQIAIVVQNQRLLRDAQISAEQLGRQVRVLETINLLATGIETIQDDNEFLNQSIQSMVETLDVQHGIIMLFAPTAEFRRIVAEYPGRGAVGVQVVREENLFLRYGNDPLVFNDIETDERLPDNIRARLLRLKLTATVLLPLIVRENIIGIIGIDYYEGGRQFSAEVVESARIMAAQFGLLLQNIRLFTDTQHRAEQLQRIANFGQSVQGTLELGTILNIMLVETAQTVSVDRMTVALYDTTHKNLRIVAQHENDRSSVNLNSTEILDTNQGFIGEVWQSHELSHFPDLHDISNTRDIQETDQRSLIIAPLRSRGRLLGLITVGDVRPYAYSDTDIIIFQQMINQLSVAVDNAEAYAQSQRVAKNESLVNEIASRLQQQGDIQHMLDITINELGQALGARHGRIRLSLPRSDQEAEPHNGTDQ
jgi:GAF domain-containing protein